MGFVVQGDWSAAEGIPGSAAGDRSAAEEIPSSSTKPWVICCVRAPNTVASRRRAPPKSVAASTTPAQTIPMQISLARVTASINASPLAPPVAPNSSLATMAAVNPASAAA
jgi:hypothetical protein